MTGDRIDGDAGDGVEDIGGGDVMERDAGRETHTDACAAASFMRWESETLDEAVSAERRRNGTEGFPAAPGFSPPPDAPVKKSGTGSSGESPMEYVWCVRSDDIAECGVSRARDEVCCDRPENCCECCMLSAW